jgi:hypothetical protein
VEALIPRAEKDILADLLMRSGRPQWRLGLQELERLGVAPIHPQSLPHEYWYAGSQTASARVSGNWFGKSTPHQGYYPAHSLVTAEDRTLDLPESTQVWNAWLVTAASEPQSLLSMQESWMECMKSEPGWTPVMP